MGDSLTWCKDFWMPKALNTISVLANVGCIAIGIILIGVFSDIEINESRFDFRCNAKIDKDFIRGKCFVQYEKRYNKWSIPLYGFVVVNFLLPVIVCTIYSQVVKSRIHELEAYATDVERRQNRTSRINGLEASNAADVERQVPPGNRTQRKLFTMYCCQLATRLCLGILFIVFLQSEVCYPRNFPSNFKCNLTREDNHTANAIRNTQAQSYECHNQRAPTKSSWAYVMTGANGILVLVLLFEIFIILSRARIKGINFMQDLQFFADHLKSNSDPPQQSSQQLSSLTQREQTLQESLDKRNQETSEELQQQDSSQQPAFIKSIKENVLKKNKELSDLPPPFQPEVGIGETKDLEPDQIYTKLVIYPGRVDYDFTGHRREQLKVYPKPQANLSPKRPEDIINAEHKNVLVVGRPGIGKTSFCTKLLRDWASDRVFSKAQNAEMYFDVAFLLKFRRFNNSSADLNLRKLLDCSEFSTPMDDVAWDYIVENPSKVLLIFDGIDEFNANTEIAKGDSTYQNTVEEKMPLHVLYNKIASGKLLHGATVLTTTRPTAVSCVKHLKFDRTRTFEILGFASEEVEDYVKKFTRDDKGAGETIWQHISSNPNLFSLCYIPVNCFIICSCLLHVLNEHTLNLAGLPTKLTQIYSIATKLLFFRHSDGYRFETDSQDKSLKSFDDLPDNVKENFKQLEGISFKGIKEGRLTFGSEEVSKLEDCGLLHCLPNSKAPLFKESKPQYCFTHLTIQEFLAAKHITDTMNDAELREFVSDHIHDGAWQVVLQFVAGLLSDREEPLIDIFIDLLPVETDEQRLIQDEGSLWSGPTLTCWPCADYKRDLVVTLSHCLYEIDAKDSVIQNKIREIGFNAVNLRQLSLTPVDCRAIVNLLKNHKEMLSINLSCNNIGSQLGCKEIQKLFTSCKLISLNLGSNNITSEGIKHLVKALEHSNLSSLNLSNNNITDEGIKHLVGALKHSDCKLNSLGLTSTNITSEGIEHLFNVLEESNCKLSSLDLSENGITDEDIKHSFKVLEQGNCKLSSLNLGRNKITSESIKHLVKVLKQGNCKLSSLKLAQSNITTEDIKHLVKVFKNSDCKLRSLNLAHNNITSEGIKHLVKVLEHSDCKLSSLDLSGNDITSEDIKHLVEVLWHRNCKLSSLNLSNNNITDEDIKYSVEALKHVHSYCKLSSLDLSCNYIADEGIKHLVKVLNHSNCKLSSLDLSVNNITYQGIKHLLEVLRHRNWKLSSLNLRVNYYFRSSEETIQLIEAFRDINCKLLI